MRSDVFLVLAALSLVFFFNGCGGSSQSPAPPSPPPPNLTFALQPAVSGLNAPLALEHPDDDSGRLFVVEQTGTIRVIQSGTLVSGNFLDIQSKVTSGGEKGLLGLAFHPGYSQNPRFYVNYTRTLGGQLQSVIAEYQSSNASANQAITGSERILLTYDQPFENHNGGKLAFGADGDLYIGAGDGGSGGDPQGNGQNVNVLLGKILRIDVDHTSGGMQYAIPADNPFAAGGGAAEIWAYGFRNPWRFSFDRTSHGLYCGDVGQAKYEEVDLVAKGGNYGWNVMEGTHCYNASTCNMSGLTEPILDYDHTQGESIIGGYVYRGTAIPSFVGKYVFGDFISGKIWYFDTASNTPTRTELLSTGRGISSFGEDDAGEIYVVDYAGSVLKLVAQ